MPKIYLLNCSNCGKEVEAGRFSKKKLCKDCRPNEYFTIPRNLRAMYDEMVTTSPAQEEVDRRIELRQEAERMGMERREARRRHNTPHNPRDCQICRDVADPRRPTPSVPAGFRTGDDVLVEA